MSVLEILALILFAPVSLTGGVIVGFLMLRVVGFLMLRVVDFLGGRE